VSGADVRVPGVRVVHPALRLAARLELLSLVVLLGNLATVHDGRVAAAVGPVHGGLYLAVVLGLVLREGTPARARLLGLVPGAGGLLAVRALGLHHRSSGSPA